MKRNLAPWRMKYILRARKCDCFLCAAIQTADDEDSLVLKRGETCFVIMNLYPYNNGHLMIVPYRHVADLNNLNTEERAELLDLTASSTQVLNTVMQPDGFNIGINMGPASGAGLKEHLHQHIVPRWTGDTNFMPVVGNTKVIPQDLYELRDKLRRVFAGGEDA